MKARIQTMKKKPIVVDHNEILFKLLEKYKSTDYKYDLTNLVQSTIGDIQCYCKIHDYQTNRQMKYLLNPNMTNWCPHCAHILRVKNKQKSYDIVIKELSEIYNNFYFYPEQNRDTYKTLGQKIKIVCPTHGEFIKRAGKHYIQGCFRCRMDDLIKNRILIGGYSQEYFDKNPDFIDLPGYIYYVKIGNMYKIGITKNLKNRLRGLKRLFNKEVILIDSITCTMFDAWKTEDYILKTYKDARLFTKQQTELFPYDILNGKIEIYKHTPTK